MRTKSSILNIITSYLGQLSSLIIVLICRYFFVKTLGHEYLGLNGLFSNILMILSLLELGVGPAITYSLYKPLATSNEEKIKSLLDLYRKVYIIIGCSILIIGSSLSFFLNFFIKDMPNIPNLKLIYILFVIYSSVSYFFAYKKSLINCSNKRYILPIYKYSIYFIANIAQIIFLLLTKNYIVYLILQIISVLIENILVSIKADKLYPFIKDKKIKELDKKTKNEITKNTKAMIFHKLGSVLVRSTDNIIISKFISLIAVGLYSNYLLVTQAFDNVANQLFNSLTSSVGNLYATEDKNKSYDIFKCVFFVNFALYYVFISVLLVNINPFIELWLGKELLLDFSIVIVIIINIYLNGMRKSVLIFRDALGLYYQDRYKPIFESLINIIVSIVLAKKIGLIGVFIGTTICILTTSFWVEPTILFKYGFNEKRINFWKKYIIYTLTTLLGSLLSLYLSSYIMITGIIGFIIKLIISLFIPIISVIILYRKTYEYNYIFNIVKSLKRIMK